MEDAKSGHLETTFGGNHKEIEISDVHIIVLSNNAPDLSVLSVDRWRLWRLGGEQYGNIIWPCTISPFIKKVTAKSWNITWTVPLNNIDIHDLGKYKQYRSIEMDHLWLSTPNSSDPCDKYFFESKQYVKDLVTNMNNSPNYIKVKAVELVEGMVPKSVINFTKNKK